MLRDRGLPLPGAQFEVGRELRARVASAFRYEALTSPPTSKPAARPEAPHERAPSHLDQRGLIHAGVDGEDADQSGQVAEAPHRPARRDDHGTAILAVIRPTTAMAAPLFDSKARSGPRGHLAPPSLRGP
jgi:hypothetical protein